MTPLSESLRIAPAQIWVGPVIPSAANAERFYPLAADDPGFVRWAHRIALRLKNLPPNAPEHDVRRVVFGYGAPGSEWGEALIFLLTCHSVIFEKETRK